MDYHSRVYVLNCGLFIEICQDLNLLLSMTGLRLKFWHFGFNIYYCQWQSVIINYSMHRHGMHRHAQQPFFPVSSATRVTDEEDAIKPELSDPCQNMSMWNKWKTETLTKTWQTKHEQQCTCKHGQWQFNMVNDKHAFSRRFSVRVRA